MICNLKRIIAAAALSLFVCLSTTHAQDAFEDEKGDSSIFLRDGGGFARVNVSDTSVKLGHVFDRSDKKIFYGFEVIGKLSGDFASLFASHKPSPEAKFNAFIGRRFLLSDKPGPNPTTGRLTDDWMTFRLGYSRARYKLLDEGNTFANQVRKQSFDGFSAIISYNALFKSKKGPYIFGIAGGAERRNNVEDLDEVEVNDQIFTSSNGTTQRSAVAKQTALTGTYEETTAVPIRTDFVFFPKQFESRIGLNFFTRANVGQGDKNFEPGVGLFFSKEGEPTRVVGGISVSLRDGKARVGLVAGYNF